MVKRVGLGFIALGIILTVGARRAEAASIDFLGLGSYSVVNIIGPVSGNVYAGELEWAWIGAPPAGFQATFSSFCLDIKNYLVDGQAVTVRPTDDFNAATDAGGKAAWLVNSFASTITGSQANVMAAALQVAIWEVVYDAASINLAGGTFILGTGGAILSQAQTFLTALGQHSADGWWLDTDRGQDQIVVGTPEPGTLSLLALGAGLLASYRRRRTGSLDASQGH